MFTVEAYIEGEIGKKYGKFKSMETAGDFLKKRGYFKTVVSKTFVKFVETGFNKIGRIDGFFRVANIVILQPGVRPLNRSLFK